MIFLEYVWYLYFSVIWVLIYISFVLTSKALWQNVVEVRQGVFFTELGKYFEILDRKFNRVVVKFNGSKDHPLIIDGWSDVRHTLCIQGDRMVLLTYLKNNSFFIKVYDEHPIDPFKLPSDHTYRLGLNDNDVFIEQLTAFIEQLTAPQLVRIYLVFVWWAFYSLVNIFSFLFLEDTSQRIRFLHPVHGFESRCIVWTSRWWSSMQCSEQWSCKEDEHKIWCGMDHFLQNQWF